MKVRDKARVEEVREGMEDILEDTEREKNKSNAVTRILSLKYKDGKPMLGIISDDQGVTEWKLKDVRDELGNAVYVLATQDMLASNFRRVIIEEE